MRAFEIRTSFGLENLVPVERPSPAVGPGQVRLQMRAASLNYRDLLTVQGLYNKKQRLPLVPLSDGVGEVVEVGAGVSRVAVGDRVCPIFAQGWLAGEPELSKLKTTLGGPLDGVLAEEAVFSAEGVVHAPPHLSDEEAACLPCAGVTAWSALFTHGGLKPGETVLVQGSGGVSTFALILARAAGARVIATSGRDDRRVRLTALGAAATVNYRETPDWGKRVRELTGGRGVDHVIEVGGAGTLTQSLLAVRPGGTISVIGVLAGASEPLNVLPILMQNVRLQGVIVGHRESFEAMNRALTEGRLRPVIDRVFPVDEVRQALLHMAEAAHFGKIVLRW